MNSKRLTRLRNEYRSRALKANLRLTDKRIRRLERERIRTAKSFEATYRTYRKKRIAHSEAYIAKRYALELGEAKEMRKLSVRTREPFREVYKKYFEHMTGGEGGGEEVIDFDKGVPITTNFLELYTRIMDIREAIGKGKMPKDFSLSLSFGETSFEGRITDVVLQDFKDEGHEQFPEDPNDYWILDSGLVSGHYLPEVSLTARIATDRTEVASGEAEVKG